MPGGWLNSAAAVLLPPASAAGSPGASMQQLSHHHERCSARAGPGPSSARLLMSAAAAPRGRCSRALRTHAAASTAPEQLLAAATWRAPILACAAGGAASCKSPAPAAPAPARWQPLPRRRLRAAAAGCSASAPTAALAAAGACAGALSTGQPPRHPQQLCGGHPSGGRRGCAAAGGAPRPGRSAQARAASIALADPTAAAAATVAATAAVTASISFSKVAAVVLGYAVMAGSLFRSVPQIAKVLRHGSTEGLSLTSYIVELCCYSVTIAYNISMGYGFNTFGEVCACWAQDIILIGLIFRFSSTRKWVAALTGAGVAAGCAWLLSPACPPKVLAALQASNILTMALGSRLPQIVLNMRRGNAGVLSVTTCLLNVAGNLARVFTTVVLTGDALLLGGYLSQGTLNSILLCQSVGTAKQQKRGAGRAADAVPGAAAKAPAGGPDAAPPGAGGGLVMQPAT